MFIVNGSEELTRYSTEFCDSFDKMLARMTFLKFFTESVSNCVNNAFTQL